MEAYDVVIVGASIAGSTAATLLGRRGLRVALVEKSPDAAHYKHLCTHEVLALANPVLERLGVLERARELSGGSRASHLWTRYGWIRPIAVEGRPLRSGINVRREVLDPMIRAVARDTPGVDLLLGTTVVDVLRSPFGRPDGVRVRHEGQERDLRCRLVVGADGQHSTVAKQTGVEPRTRRHERFGYAAYFEGVRYPHADPEPTARLWFLDPDMAYSFPTDGGLTLLTVSPRRTPERLAAFKKDIDGEFRKAFDAVPDGPDLAAARIVGRYEGLVKTRNARRRASRPGLAFIGDAAQVTDFVWGTGCGFALASAEWLADLVGPALATGRSDRRVDRALRAYRRRHRRRLLPHYLITSDYSTGRGFSLLERTLFRAGAHDPRVARALDEMGQRTASPLRLITPPVLARAVVASVRRGGRPRASRSGVTGGRVGAPDGETRVR